VPEIPWSDDARVMAHPFRAYADLAGNPGERTGRALAVRVALVLLVLGGAVSLLSAGRLVAFHVASTMVFWSFIPAVQAAVFAAVVRLLHRGEPRPALAPALALYFTGHGPWLLFFLLVAGMCLFATDVYATFRWLLGHYVLPGTMLGAIVWSGAITFACFRAGLGWARGRAAGATALFYGGFSGAIVGYYLAMNEIQPQVPWAP
jgi:hypothetical protein